MCADSVLKDRDREHMCVSICICMCRCIHTHIHMSTYIQRYQYVHTYKHTCTHTYIKIDVYVQNKAVAFLCAHGILHLEGIKNRHFCSDSKINQILVILGSLSRVFFHQLCFKVLQCIAVCVAVCCRVLVKRRNRQTKSISALSSLASSAAMQLCRHKRKQDRKKAKVPPPPQLSIKTPRVINNNYISYQ